MNLFNIFEGLWRGGEPDPIEYRGWRYVPELLFDVEITKKLHHVFDPGGRELTGKENPFDDVDSRIFGPYGTWADEAEFKKFVDSQEIKKTDQELPAPVMRANKELEEEEPEPAKTASKNRFDPTRPVEAYGYVYDRRDQRQHWSKTFPNEAALDLWVRRNNATVIGMLNKKEAGVPPTEEYAIYADGRMIKKAASQADAERALLKIQHEHPGKEFEIRRRSMVLTSALAEAARVGNVYRDDVPGTYGAGITDKQYIESTGEEGVVEGREEDWGNWDGWHDTGIAELWPSAEIRKLKIKGQHIDQAIVNGKVVGEWNHGTNKGYVDTGDSDVSEGRGLNFCSDKTPKSTGLTFEQLNKLTESAGMDFEKFDTALKKNLNLPAWVNTLEIFGVYARKLNEQKNGRLLVETQLTDIEKNLFNELDRYSNESIDSAKIGDKVALLHLQTIDIPGHKVVAQLNGFLHPKEITGITSNKGFKQLKFADGSMFPKNDDIAFHMIQSWNMTKLFPNYDSASKAYLMFAIQGDNQNKDLEFKINVAKNMNEGDVIHTKFATKQAQRGWDRYHKVEGLDIPVFDRAVGRAMPPNLAKDPIPFDHFVARRGKVMRRGVTKQGNWYSIIGVLPNGKEYTASTTPSEQLANALADAYNRGGFSDTDLKRVPVKGYDESVAPITKRYVLYLNNKPAAHYASKSEAESQAAMVLAKHPNTKYKILSKKQGMLESGNKGKNMRLKELTEGISSQDLGNVLFDRLEYRFPNIVAQHGHEVVADAVMHVAEFHAGAEELGSSDISIMLKQVLEYIKERQ